MPTTSIDLTDSSSHSLGSTAPSRTSSTKKSVNHSETGVHAGKKVEFSGLISNGVLHIDLSIFADKLKVTEANDGKPASVDGSNDSRDLPGRQALDGNKQPGTSSDMEFDGSREVNTLEVDLSGDQPASIEESNSIQRKAYHIELLTAAADGDLVCPIQYVYDYLPHSISWLRTQRISIPDEILGQIHPVHKHTRENSIALRPGFSGLPIHTGLVSFRQNKHWEANLRASTELLDAFAQDQRCKDAALPDERSMATWAQEELVSKVSECVSRFAIYMCPDGDEERLCLLGQTVVLIFIFDDMWEHASSIIEDHVRDDFVARIKGRTSSSIADTPLQKRIDEIRESFLRCDSEAGNGGGQVLETLVDFCKHSYPKDFSGVREYLDYRFEDIANGFTWSCAKFAVRSSVDQHAAKFHCFLRSLGDQISITNDIASYEKELVQFRSSKAAHMINLVHVIMESYRLDAEAAKSMAYAWQLHSEDRVGKEIEAFRRTGNLSLEEWRFLEACLHAASGNLFTSVVISRYGGEEARLNKKPTLPN